MNHNQFLDRVINDGIQAAKRDYGSGEKLQGSIAGFNTCRNRSIAELKEILEASHVATQDARLHQANNYWWYRCYEVEVEWVCNCFSVVLQNEGLSVIIPPTARAAMQVAQIVGVKEL